MTDCKTISGLFLHLYSYIRTRQCMHSVWEVYQECMATVWIVYGDSIRSIWGVLHIDES